MVLESLKIGTDLSVLLKQKVAQSVYDALTGVATAKGSLPRQGNMTKIVAPLIATDDIPADDVVRVAKATEIKLAMDVRTYLETNIRETAQDVNVGNVMRSIPVTILNKGAGNNQSITEMMRDRFNVAASDRLGLTVQESLQYELEKEAIEFSDVHCTVHYSEAGGNGSNIISDRNALPTHVRCEVKYVTGRGEIKTAEFSVSVECAPKYVNSNELRARISSYSNRDFYKNFVRMEKGEINFITDWLLDLKMLKYKAKAASKGNNNIFNIVDRYRLLNDMGVNVYPFLTMLLSNTFVDDLRNKEHMDLYRDGNEVMKKFFAMGIYMYDQDMNTIEIKYDGDRDWKKYPFDDIGRDTDKYERQLRELVKFNK